MIKATIIRTELSNVNFFQLSLLIVGGLIFFIILLNVVDLLYGLAVRFDYITFENMSLCIYSYLPLVLLSVTIQHKWKKKKTKLLLIEKQQKKTKFSLHTKEKFLLFENEIQFFSSISV